MPRKPDPESVDRFIDAGLPSLREVPPMQMSAERLRDAVLAGGLAGREAKTATTPWYAWAWAPLAAAAIAVVIVPRLRSTPNLPPAARPDAVAVASSIRLPSLPPIAPSSSRLAETVPATPEPGFNENSDLVEAMMHEVTASAPSLSSRPSPSLYRTRRHVSPRRPSRAVSRASEIPAEWVAMVAETKDARPSALAQATPKALPVTSVAASGTKPSDSIVLMTSDVDASTGAATATEVDSHANISVGG